MENTIWSTYNSTDSKSILQWTIVVNVLVCICWDGLIMFNTTN